MIRVFRTAFYDKIVDAYCTPIVLTITDVKDGVIYGRTNFCNGEVKEYTVEEIHRNYIFQCNNLISDTVGLL